MQGSEITEFGGEKNQREIREIGMVKEVRGRLLRSKEMKEDQGLR